MSREKLSQHEQARIARWAEEADRVERITDGLGLRIDEGIRETIIGIRVFDIETLASCEGHLEWGVKAPWIDIGAELPAALRHELGLAMKRGDQEAETKIRDEVRRRNLVEIQKVLPLLDGYYQGRDVAFDRRLIIESRTRGGRLISQGGLVQTIREAAEVEEHLRAYKDEMASFTTFLREKYLHG